MAINLEDPKKLKPLREQVHQVAMNMLRPISRKYDKAEHEYPTELDMLAAMADGLAESGQGEGAGATGVRRDSKPDDGKVKNGANMSSVLSVSEMCWGDVGLTLAMPRQERHAVSKQRTDAYRAGRAAEAGVDLVGLHVVKLGQVVDTGTADHGQGDLLHSKHSMKRPTPAPEDAGGRRRRAAGGCAVIPSSRRWPARSAGFH